MKRTGFNYPLLFGSLITALFVALAIVGPSLAPHDPMAETGLIEVNGVRYGPPPFPRVLPPFTSADYPLGHDDISRDVLSRLLWAVRPTLLLCVVIVATRVALGVALGLIGGWFRPLGRALEWLSSLAVALPLLVFALGTILALGLSRGTIAFVIGLSLTGWVDTAALVKSRVAAVRVAPYIESAWAIGQRQRGVLLRHVLPQVWPLLPVLATFELSAVLLVIAELGYLGFYVGGGYVYQWFPDFGPPVNMIRSGLPELGQMLSDFWGQLYRTPWVSLSAGGVTALMLVGFALLSEGLRRQLDVTRPRRVRSWSRWIRSADANAAPPVVRRPVPLLVAAVLLVYLVGSSVLRTTPDRTADQTSSPLVAIGSDGPTAAARAVSTTPIAGDQATALALEPLVYQPGDLPDAFEKYQVSNQRPYYFSNAPAALSTIDISFKRDGVTAANATVLLYVDTAQRHAAYDAVVQAKLAAVPTLYDRAGNLVAVPTNTPPPTLDSLGENAAVFNSDEVMFARCGAVVYVRISAPRSDQAPDLAQQYARMIDQRLAPRVCAQ